MAEEHLKEKGFRTLARNYFSKTGEIDLIMEDKEGYCVFIEVKKRTGIDYGRPIEHITRRKMQKVKRTAEHYIARNHLKERDFRFDAVEIIEWRNGAYEINHIENIWME